MKNRAFELALFACCLLSAVCVRADGESDRFAVECRKSAEFLAPPADSGPERQYAPDREVQMAHVALDITPDFKTRTISAEATLRLRIGVRPVREVRLNAVDLNVLSVNATRKVQAWQDTDEHLVITFEEPVPEQKEVTVTIRYSAEPTSGLYFRTREMGYPEGDDHLFTQGEAIQARHWYPCLDAPNQKCTSEVTCHVPQGMTAISNGRLVSETRDPATGLLAIHWSQEKRHSNYLITLVAGYFKKIEDTCHGVPMAFYTPPSEIEYARSTFRDTKDMILFFEQEIGVPYPWAKYDQVCVHDFVAGGMENTSATTLTDRTLYSDETENIHNSEGLVSHELAHQWFGDLVTCKDWSHIWLNEGFATFYETLWNEHHLGRDNMLYELYHRTRQITGMQNDNNAIVRRTYAKPDDMFGYLVYPKAAWVLHMLRAQLGPELYRKCIKTYLERHLHGNVVTEDLRAVVEELSGRPFDRFFDQWLYHGRQPELEIGYSWDELTKLAKVSIRQTQDVNASVLLFQFPLTIRFTGKSGTADRTIQVTQKQEDFYFPLDSAPDLVRVDPEYTLLAKIKFPLSRPMLAAQLASGDDVIGRLLGIEQLAEKKNQDSIKQLKRLLNEDAFYGVRIEAANALRSIHNDEALAALLASTKQPDARVRLQVTEAIGGFYDSKAWDYGRQIVGEEKNPDIVGAAIRDLAGYARPELHDLLIKYLDSTSFRNELALASIGAMRSQDDPAFISPLMQALTRREAAFTSRGFAQGLSALAYLARNEEDKNAVFEFLARHANSRRRTVQLAAISGLGTLGDTKAMAILKRFSAADEDSPQAKASETALTQLRAGRKPVDDFKNLRQEVLDLQKANRDLKKEVEDLKKQVEAMPESATTPSRGSRHRSSAPTLSPKASEQ